MENEFLDVWNHSHQKHFHGKIIYDDWLKNEPFFSIIENENGLYLDLGCGQGNNTLYLIEKNKNVLSCDLSDEALKIVKNNIANSKTIQLDMCKPLIFNKDSFSVIISDFSLQYFDLKTTLNIIKELKRILKERGYLILRLSSINDVNYGALVGKKIENHFYYVEKRNKRFYNLTDINYFFKDWNIIYVKEKKSKLDRYEYERSYYEVLVRNNK